MLIYVSPKNALLNLLAVNSLLLDTAAGPHLTAKGLMTAHFALESESTLNHQAAGGIEALVGRRVSNLTFLLTVRSYLMNAIFLKFHGFKEVLLTSVGPFLVSIMRVFFQLVAKNNVVSYVIMNRNHQDTCSRFLEV
mgnify:CR=1 FL=1